MDGLCSKETMVKKDNDIRKDVLFIRAGSKKTGLDEDPQHFAVIPPYIDKNLLMRIIREAWFRLGLPLKSIWYNKDVLSFEGKHLIVYDPQITRRYLLWLQKQDRWNIHYYYGNKVGRARHIKPNKIPVGIPVWTYDDRDSRDYGLNYCTKSGGNPACFYEKQQTEYDVMFVGKDKGRGEFIFYLESELKAAGLRTFFRVVPETRFQKNKDLRYGSAISYDEICKLIAKSRAILNVALPGQEGHTIRDTEAIWNNVKLITTNTKTKERSYYRPENILVIEENKVNVSEICSFLGIPMKPYERDIQEQFLNSCWIKEIIEKL